MNRHMILEKKGGLAIMTINRPEVLNALDADSIDEIREMLRSVEKDSEVKVVIMTGAGKAFCVGMDLAMAKDFDTKSAGKFSDILHETCFQIESIGKPTIAAINGYALGLGLEIAMSCDMRIASTNAKFGQPEVKIGVIPGAGGTQRLPLIAGKSKAKEMIFTGETIDANEAYRIGLVDRITDGGILLEEASNLAARMMDNSMDAIRKSKILIDRSLGQDFKSEQRMFSECFETHDQEEGMKAFFEKRRPKFD